MKTKIEIERMSLIVDVMGLREFQLKTGVVS